MLFYSFKSFSFKLFKFILSFWNICGLYLFINLFGNWRRWHLCSTHFTMTITHWINKSTNLAWPLHHHSLILYLFLFLLILLLYFLNNLFFNKFSNIPSLYTNNKFIIFCKEIKFRTKYFSFILFNDFFNFFDKLCPINKVRNLRDF